MDSVLLLTDLVAVWLDLASQGCSSAKSWIAFINNQTCCTAGFIAAHTLPVLYERYDEQIDSFVYNFLDQFRNQYKKLDAGVLSKIPKGKFKLKKHD
ncbi:Reticulon - like 4 [Theobroma cacao]|nr:Reticulon - like 4 [Theobroma cacao]